MSAVARRMPSASTAWTAVVLVFLFLPIAVVVLFSLQRVGTGTFPLGGLSLHWYDELVKSHTLVLAARNSLIVAVATAAATTLVGSLAAFALVRHRVRGSQTLVALILLPIVVPYLLLGVALLSFLSKIAIPLSLLTVIIGHVLVTLPFFVLTVNTSLQDFDPSFEEAAATLGASPWQRLRHVTLPILRPSLIGAALLVAAISLDEFVVTYFTVGDQSTLPIVIWGQMRAGVSPVVNAVSTLMLLATLLAIVAVRRLTGGRFS